MVRYRPSRLGACAGASASACACASACAGGGSGGSRDGVKATGRPQPCTGVGHPLHAISTESARNRRGEIPELRKLLPNGFHGTSLPGGYDKRTRTLWKRIGVTTELFELLPNGFHEPILLWRSDNLLSWNVDA
jgi:hypothetical protein